MAGGTLIAESDPFTVINWPTVATDATSYVYANNAAGKVTVTYAGVPGGTYLTIQPPDDPDTADSRHYGAPEDSGSIDVILLPPGTYEVRAHWSLTPSLETDFTMMFP
jgi:hypothetical protein